jgi:hypothetical protein
MIFYRHFKLKQYLQSTNFQNLDAIFLKHTVHPISQPTSSNYIKMSIKNHSVMNIY